MKPKIKATRHLGLLIYLCVGDYIQGWGNTVQRAYENWLQAYRSERLIRA